VTNQEGRLGGNSGYTRALHRFRSATPTFYVCYVSTGLKDARERAKGAGERAWTLYVLHAVGESARAKRPTPGNSNRDRQFRLSRLLLRLFL
jgi:hypothetical protein